MKRNENELNRQRFSAVPELLCPCGGEQALRAAVFGGADAVYLGGTAFNARMNAGNFDKASLERSVAFCHSRGVRVYVTLNTLVTDRMIPEALDFAAFLYNIGVDALIVADCGLSLLIRERIPDFELHASTQFSVHSLDGVRWLADQGFRRAVVARELSRRSLETICRESPIEIEVFVHGALCACHSGQCLMSSFLGGRSGNRGECAQPCRMSYNGAHPLSLKDLCLAGHIEELISIGAASLKIEGRMKSPAYVYNVTLVYRRLLDERRNADEKEIAALARVFSRGGFTDGYFTGRLKDMSGVRSEADKRASGTVVASSDDRAPHRPPLAVVRERRPAPEKPLLPARPEQKPCLSARFSSAKQIVGEDFFDLVYLPLFRFEKGVCRGVVLPSVVTDAEAPAVRERLELAAANGAEHVLIGNPGHIRLTDGLGLTLHGDFRLNVQNSFAGVYSSVFSDLIVSPELNLAQIRDLRIRKTVIVYGRIPLMLLERRLAVPSLRDSRGAVFPVSAEGARDLVLNSVPIYMADMTSKLKDAGVIGRHFFFTDESPVQAARIVDAYRKGLPAPAGIRRIR